jgi:arylsulfatase
MKQPNIILITTDQQRYDTLAPYAPPFMRTPHIDHLMRDGIVFDRAYADCPICVASRASILTGKLSRNHGLPNNNDTSSRIGRENTLPTLLRAAGYQTAAIGKMHFGPERCRHGFDEMILPADYYLQMSRSGSPVQPMRHGLGQNELYPGMATVPEAQTLTAWTAEQCVEYIKTRRDPTVPFFLWCSFSKPHPPLDPPEPYYSMYRNCPIPEPIHSEWSLAEDRPIAFRRQQESWASDLIPPEIIREARAAYYGLITQIDYNVGRVFAALQDHNMFGETLFVFTSDHGEFLGDHHTACKIFPHEVSARIPFILRLPKSWQGRRYGERVKHLTSLADILPTLVTAAGGKPPANIDGLDLLSVLGGSTAPRPHLMSLASWKYPEPNHTLFLGITDGRWKYSWYLEGPSEQLFDVETDPQELRNLAQVPAHAAKKKELREALVRLEKQYGSEYLVNGDLAAVPPRGDTTAERRSNPWPGYHTELYNIDVRH